MFCIREEGTKMLDFTDKVVLITRIIAGIGRSIAQLFAGQGARIAVHFHANEAAAKETLKFVDGKGHFIVQGDIADPNAVAGIVDRGGAHRTDRRADQQCRNIWRIIPWPKWTMKRGNKAGGPLSTQTCWGGESVLLCGPTDDYAGAAESSMYRHVAPFVASQPAGLWGQQRRP